MNARTNVGLWALAFAWGAVTKGVHVRAAAKYFTGSSRQDRIELLGSWSGAGNGSPASRGSGLPSLRTPITLGTQYQTESARRVSVHPRGAVTATVREFL